MSDFSGRIEVVLGSSKSAKTDRGTKILAPLTVSCRSVIKVTDFAPDSMLGKISELLSILAARIAKSTFLPAVVA
jgi:hypothetical protein